MHQVEEVKKNKCFLFYYLSEKNWFQCGVKLLSNILQQTRFSESDSILQAT